MRPQTRIAAIQTELLAALTMCLDMLGTLRAQGLTTS